MTTQQRELMSHIGIRRLIKPSKAKFTSLEIRYYDMLTEIGVKFVPQYPMDGRFYDAYLPEKKVLLEFDGSFWHPKTEKDATYEHQKKNFKVDRLKDQYAKERGLKLYRIREDEPINSFQLRELVNGRKKWD